MLGKLIVGAAGTGLGLGFYAMRSAPAPHRMDSPAVELARFAGIDAEVLAASGCDAAAASAVMEELGDAQAAQAELESLRAAGNTLVQRIDDAQAAMEAGGRTPEARAEVEHLRAQLKAVNADLSILRDSVVARATGAIEGSGAPKLLHQIRLAGSGLSVEFVAAATDADHAHDIRVALIARARAQRLGTQVPNSVNALLQAAEGSRPYAQAASDASTRIGLINAAVPEDLRR
jgi:hypothetical protein